MTSREKNNWDRRYDQESSFYGSEPNYFVGPELRRLNPGRGLFLGEGEGRNALYAAGLGHSVVALDNSYIGREKALRLAAQQGVHIEYNFIDLLAEDWESQEFDFVVLCFTHLPPDAMARIHRTAVACLKPGGRLIHCSFAKSQFGRKSGGPPRLDWLHDLADLHKQYEGIEFDRAEELEVDLDEAQGHRGPAMILEISGNKISV